MMTDTQLKFLMHFTSVLDKWPSISSVRKGEILNTDNGTTLGHGIPYPAFREQLDNSILYLDLKHLSPYVRGVLNNVLTSGELYYKSSGIIRCVYLRELAGTYEIM